MVFITCNYFNFRLKMIQEKGVMTNVAAAKLKEALKEDANSGERRIYLYLPGATDHTTHLNGEVNVMYIFTYCIDLV